MFWIGLAAKTAVNVVFYLFGAFIAACASGAVLALGFLPFGVPYEYAASLCIGICYLLALIRGVFALFGFIGDELVDHRYSARRTGEPTSS